MHAPLTLFDVVRAMRFVSNLLSMISTRVRRSFLRASVVKRRSTSWEVAVVQSDNTCFGCHGLAVIALVEGKSNNHPPHSLVPRYAQQCEKG